MPLTWAPPKLKPLLLEKGTTLSPTGARVLIELEDPPTETRGFEIPRGYRKKPDVNASYPARVLAVGPGRVSKRGNRVPMPLKCGDRVMVPWLNFPIQMHSGERYLIDEAAVFGILES
jgi:co-chaperonin GroES (HSP10)